MIFGVIITGVIGIFFVVLGFLLWKKEAISILHDYHYDKVSEKNKKAFCTLSGIGLIIMGIGMLITSVLLWITESAYSFLCFALSFAVGLAYLMDAQIKYNHDSKK